METAARWSVTTIGLIITAVLILAMSGCGSSGPSVSACKAAMRADYVKALTNPSAASATEPAACKGLPSATLTRLAGEVLTGQ